MSQLNRDVAQNVTIKSKLFLHQHPDESGWACYLGSDLLGHIESTDTIRLQQALKDEGIACQRQVDRLPVNVAIRTIKREPTNNLATSVQVRITEQKNWRWESDVYQATKIEDELLVPPELEDLEKDGRVVTRAQFEALAANSHVQEVLKNEEVQLLIQAVDAAPSRDAALARALNNPQFATFCDQILDIVSPS